MNRFQTTLALCAAFLCGCNSLTPEDQARLDSFKYNIKRFLDESGYGRAYEQCLKDRAHRHQDR